MRFSEGWLREWINPPVTSVEMINQLTMAGFQVEESKPLYSSVFSGIIIGEVINYKKHPNSHKLWVITVNNGTKKYINIICSDINCKKNARIVVANIGTQLPNGDVINSIIIDGEKSEGVLCTFSMLKLNQCKKEIIILPENAPVGHSFFDYLKLNDNILDINIPYNRADCLNIVGLSREIAAINRLQLKKIKIDVIQPNITDIIPIIIEDTNRCPKYLGRIIKNINITISTPINIQTKLYCCGVPSVNVVIDIINYVLLELGYPIDVFDYDTINPNAIYVRFSKNEEKLSLFDDQKSVKLLKNTLIIADSDKPLSIAGIIMGKQSMVSIKTRNIFLQSAIFNAFDIAKQSKLYNLTTFSSIRYERGLDYNLSETALNYATSLLLKVCNGDPGPVISAVDCNKLPQPNIVTLNRFKLDTVLGFNINETEVTCILKNLGFQIQLHDTFWTIFIPTWRLDITIEENLISEIIRIYGYDKIPQIIIKTDLNKSYNKKNIVSLSRVKTILVNRGYNEIITYSFINANLQKLLYPGIAALTLKNPISSDMSTMRLSLWPGLINTVIYNQNRQQKHIQLFESGICFTPNIANKNKVSQKLMIAGIRYGLRYNEHWNSELSIVDFYDIKGDIDSIFNFINKKNDQFFFKNCKHFALHPNKSAAIYFNKTLVGYVGMIHPIIHRKLNLKLNTFIFELSWDVFSKFQLTTKILPISRFPKNYRDISIIVPQYIFLSDVINSCRNLSIYQLTSVTLIDIYTGKNINKGYKGFTIRLTLQSQNNTLKEEDILNFVNICIEALKKDCHAILR